MGTMTTAVDASVVIAWQTPGHIFQADAIRLLGDAEPPLVMSEINLAEVLVGTPKAAWNDLLDTLQEMGFGFIEVTAADIASARIASHLRLPDACVLAAARNAKAEAILSFDQELNAAATSLGFATTQ